MKLSVKNWTQFQHYKDRNPPWIRLHRGLLDNKEFQRLPVASRALAPMLWLLASESLDGTINADADDLSFRLRQPEAEIVEALKPLIVKGFFVEITATASSVLAPCQTVAVPEAETEAETEQREIPAAPAPAPKQKRKSPQTPIPEDFGVSERVRTWAAGKGYGQLDEHLDAFKRKAVAKGYMNASWDHAFQEAIREDWAKLRGRTANGAVPPPETVKNAGAEQTRAYLESREAQHAADNTPEARAHAADLLKAARQRAAEAQLKRGLNA